MKITGVMAMKANKTPSIKSLGQVERKLNPREARGRPSKRRVIISEAISTAGTREK
jgi:hypothetical protein